MRTIGRYLLVHLCGTLLVLPCGWCCPAPVAKAASEAATSADTTPAPAESCCCCKTQRRQPAPERPTPERPTPEGRCVCAERTGLPTVPRAKVTLDLALALPIVPAPAVFAVEHGVPVVSEFPSNQDLHLLHCVWLC
jgi:hypothetical protein